MGERPLCLLHLYARCVRVRVQLLACGRLLVLNRAQLVFLAMLIVSDSRAACRTWAPSPRASSSGASYGPASALEHSTAFCGLCNFDVADTRALPQDQPVAPLTDLFLDAICDFRDWFTSAHQLMRSGDRSEYRALPPQLKSLLNQLEPHNLCDFPNGHIVCVYLQPLEFLQLQRQFYPKFAFHSFLSADAVSALRNCHANCAAVIVCVVCECCTCHGRVRVQSGGATALVDAGH